MLSLSLAQENQSQKSEAAAERARVIQAGIAKLQSHLQGAEISSSQVRFIYHDRQFFGLLDARQNLKILYVLPKSNCREEDNIKVLQDFKKELFPYLEDESIWPKISAKDSYAQMLMHHKSNIDSGVLYSSSLSLAQYLNSKLGPPQSWKYNRPTWQIIFNNNKSCIEIALDLNRSRMNSVDMRLLGADANIQDYCNALNPILGTKLEKCTSYDELKRWRAATGYSTTQLLAAATAQDGWRLSTLEYLVKKDLFLRLASSRTLSNGSSDSKTWVLSAPYEFPKEEVLITPYQKEVKVDESAQEELDGPPAMSLAELKELLQYFNSFTSEDVADNVDDKDPLDADIAEEDDELDHILDATPLPLNSKRAMRLYIRSLQREAQQHLDAHQESPNKGEDKGADKGEDVPLVPPVKEQEDEKEPLINAL